MTTGSFVAGWWYALLVLVVAVTIGSMVASQALAKSHVQVPDRLRRLVPSVVRRLAVARLATGLAALVRTGVPLVDAIRIVAPTLPGLAAAGLRRRLAIAAERVERGDDLADGLDDPLWFDEEMRRLIQVGQASGELPALLMRIGERYERQARRSIDRLAALLEPAVILLLAALVGLVVMGAVLPLIRLQEVI
jgi:general secretion pathway protein F